VEVAELAGVSDRFVTEVRRGKPTVRLDKLTALLDAMGPATLQAGCGDEQPSKLQPSRL
jgi:hypothetical protein